MGSCGMVVTILSLLTLFELLIPGTLPGDGHLYNVIMTADAFVITLFLAVTVITGGFGIVSYIVSNFYKPIFGQLGTVSFGVLRLIAWADRMFTVGMNVGIWACFTAAIMVIAVPTGVKVFS